MPRALVLLVVLALALGAAPPAPAQPAVRVARTVLDGHAEPHTPSPYNKAIVVRYALGTGRPRVVVVLMPGLGGGVGSLDLLARGLVTRLGPGAEVWVHERRSNLLEDHTGLAAALAAGNANFATGYYFGDLAIDGRRFREVGPVPFVGRWGLDTHLRDARAVVREARRSGARVVLGGHSLGAMLTAMYAAYDFGDGPGFRDLDGMILLDGVPGVAFPPTPEVVYLNGLATRDGRLPGVRALEAGSATPYLEDETQSPSNARLFATLGLAAAFAPDARFALPNDTLGAVPLTNEAALGVSIDDETQPSYTLRARAGAPLGEYERVRDPRRINPRGFIVVPSLRPLPRQRLVGWRRYDQVTPPELTDIRQVARAIVTPQGDFTEWYIPWRLLLDVAFAGRLDRLGPAVTRRLPLTRQREVDRPVIALGAGRGLVRERPPIDRYLRSTAVRRATVRILAGYCHLDAALASRNAAVADVAGWIRVLLQ